MGEPSGPMRTKTIHSADYRVLLKMLRVARGETPQTELAAKLRMSQSMLSKYERGELRLDIIQLRAWCKALGVDFLAFVGEFVKRTG